MDAPPDPSTGVICTTEGSANTRVLGSQELLMLPRQYSPNQDELFPQMNHVSCTILDATPDEAVLRKAINALIQTHPLLRCHVEGDGEPEERIDLFQMVRKGDPNPCRFVPLDTPFTSEDVLSVVVVEEDNEIALENSWQTAFNRDLDDGAWCDVGKGPLWKVELHRFPESVGPNRRSALLLAFNHAISDQSSANMMVDQILSDMAAIDKKCSMTETETFKIPVTLEQSVLGADYFSSDNPLSGVSTETIGYVASKAAEGFKSPVIVPDSIRSSSAGGALGALSIISGKASGGEDKSSRERRSTLQFRSLSKNSTLALLERCRDNGISITNALTAAVTLTASDFVGERKERNYKVLQSLDMRRFGDQLDQRETVACMAGSMDLLYGPITDESGVHLRENPTNSKLEEFWKLAREGARQTEAFIESNGPNQAVRVFDLAMRNTDMNNLVDLTAKSVDSQGRAYSAGVSNVGVYERQKAVRRKGQMQRDLLQASHGKYNIQDIYFATSHARTGCLYQVSGLTVNEEMKLTFHPATPIVSNKTNKEFASSFMDLLETVAREDNMPDSLSTSLLGALKGFVDVLPLAAILFGSAAVLSHFDAFHSFASSVAEMKTNASPEDFSAALNFWVFFAVSHPILQPILWISDVLHGSPGPKVLGLIPATFIAMNAIAIWAISNIKQIRDATNITLLAAFLTYVGAGLDGEAGLGDYNLGLDDPYGMAVVRGCPSYEEVRQESMASFDLTKYQGIWHEHKFHDWTQFKEVYDTTLDIKLTGDGKGWIDDFAVKGPAPESAKLSWDKSPVANGAHYFLFGRVDEHDTPGILRESGFGVEFPNYIVDVQKDPQTGEYTEAIQFQCLERGNVRVFEGINFLSRSAEMTEPQLRAMHERAKAAKLYPYGASPEQMHTVARRPQAAPAVDNNWQAMWRSVGVDKLLEMLAESIEDGGR